MDNEVIVKIHQALSADPPREADVQHLFTLARKLIERVPAPRRAEFAHLKFYCDWTLHSEIDRSEAGAQVLQRVHDVIAEHLAKKDNSTLIDDLTAVLALTQVRDELNQLVRAFAGGGDCLTDARWRTTVPILLEIISNTPLKIASGNKKLATFLAAIKARPLKGSSVVEVIRVVKVPSALNNKHAPSNQITYHIMLTTSDTTNLVVPIAA